MWRVFTVTNVSRVSITISEEGFRNCDMMREPEACLALCCSCAVLPFAGTLRLLRLAKKETVQPLALSTMCPRCFYLRRHSTSTSRLDMHQMTTKLTRHDMPSECADHNSISAANRRNCSYVQHCMPNSQCTGLFAYRRIK